MFNWLKTILQIVAAWVGYIQAQQLLAAGRAQEKSDVSEANEAARQEAKQVVIDTSKLTDSALRIKLQKWQRPDK